MDAVTISNKLFMASLILLMLVLIYHGFGWKRLFLSRRLNDERTAAPQDTNELKEHAEEVRRDIQDKRQVTVLRNPLLWTALVGIAISIVITL